MKFNALFSSEPKLLKIWLLYFLFSSSIAALVQLLIIPHFFPGWNSTFGLLNNGDSPTFHLLAVNLAGKIQTLGWSAWVLWPSGQGTSGIAGAIYALTTPSPLVLIPLNAALHATSGILVISILELFIKNRSITFWGGTLFVALPSAMIWYAQIHKDTYTIPGSLMFIWGWAMLARLDTWRSRKILAAVCLVFFGAGMIWLMRPYQVEILQLLAGLSALGLLALYIFWLARKKWNFLAFLIACAVTLGLVAILTPFVKNTPLTNQTLSDLRPVPGKPLISDWQPETWLPAFFENKVRSISEDRENYINVGGMSGIDVDVHFRNFRDVIMYMPRALQIGFLAPFPNIWFGSGSAPETTFMRKEIVFEMLAIYLGLAALLVLFWRFYRDPSFWLVVYLCACMIVSYALVVVNIGTLVRFRFGFLILLVSVGVSGFADWYLPERENLQDLLRKITRSMREINTPEPVYDSANHIHPALEELKSVFRYRFLIFQLVQRDILTRYKRSVLGVAWTMLNPLGMMIILSLVFSSIFASATPAYPVFLLGGLLGWNFFAQGTNASMYSMVWGGSLLHRIFIPRSTFVFSAIVTALVNLALSLVPLLLVTVIMQVPIRWSILFLPVPMLLLACFSLGLGLMLSTLAIYYPDVVEMYQIILTGWFYLTPVIYPIKIIPSYLLFIVQLNPMYYLINLYRLPLYDGRMPTAGEFLPAVAYALGYLILGWIIFTSKSDEFAYHI